MFLLALIVLLSLLVFYTILQTDFSGVVKFFLVIIEMLLVSRILIKRYKLPSEMGLILVKSKRGIRVINALAKKERVWKFFADMGTTLSYGLFSAFLMRKNTSLKSVVLGMFLLIVVFIVIAPVAMLFLQTILTGTPIFDKAEMISTGNSELMALVVLAILLLFGFFGILLFGILYYGAFVFARLLQLIITGVDTLSSTPPSGTLLLPGVNLPFFEGILALIVIMVVHEGSHAVLAKMARVPIKSSGVVLFGIIPIGAFVEPDEKKLEKVERVRQTRVLSAGSTANFVSSLLFFLPFMAVLLLLSNGVFHEGELGYIIFRFIYITTGLTFTLNFVVAAVNLLPLPLFDGYRILEVNIQNKQIVKAIMFITLAAFILNFLPWLFI